MFMVVPNGPGYRRRHLTFDGKNDPFAYHCMLLHAGQFVLLNPLGNTTIKFSPDGTLVDQDGNTVNGTVFIALPEGDGKGSGNVLQRTGCGVVSQWKFLQQVVPAYRPQDCAKVSLPG